MSENLRNDVDPIETQDWLASLDSLIEEGLERAQFIIEQVLAKLVQVAWHYQQA